MLNVHYYSRCTINRSTCVRPLSLSQVKRNPSPLEWVVVYIRFLTLLPRQKVTRHRCYHCISHALHLYRRSFCRRSSYCPKSRLYCCLSQFVCTFVADDPNVGWDVVEDDFKVGVFSRHQDTVHQSPQVSILERLPPPSPPVKFPPMPVDPDAINAEFAIAENDKTSKRCVPVQCFTNSEKCCCQLCPVDSLLAPRRGTDIVW